MVDRTTNGDIAISIEVRGADNKIIATIDKNWFNVTNRALATHKPRPDKSTLVVYDEEGNEVLNVRYLNPSGLRISGIMYYGGTRIELPIRNLYEACFGGSGTDFDYN